MNTKFSLKQFREKYGTHEQCLEVLKQARFPEPYTCPKCKTVQRFYPVTGRTAYACNSCGHHIFPLVGTIFEKSTTPLDMWFFAMYLMTQTRSGTSAKQLERMLGVTYKTAWRMFKQIRMLMSQTDGNLLTGVVEIDETYVGGSGTNRKFKWHGTHDNKEIVMGMVERNGKVYLKHVPDTYNYTLLNQIKEHVDPTATIMTDQLPTYLRLPKMGYEHYYVNHHKTYVTHGTIHTQNIENMWSGIKRGIYGVYRKVSPKYLQAYVDEYGFRYNNRKNPMMFDVLLGQVTEVKSLGAGTLS